MKISRKELEKMLDEGIDLNPTARMVLMAYARHMTYGDKPEESWPSDETICTFAGISGDTLKTHRDALIKDGFLILIRRVRGKEAWINYYCLGRGEPKTKAIQRRKPTDKQRANLIANARKKKKDGTLPKPVLESVQNDSLESVQNDSLESVQKPVLDSVETNNHRNNQVEEPVEESSRDAGASLTDDEKNYIEDDDGQAPPIHATGRGSLIHSEGADGAGKSKNKGGEVDLDTLQNEPNGGQLDAPNGDTVETPIDWEAKAREEGLTYYYEYALKVPTVNGTPRTPKSAYKIAARTAGEEVKV